MSLNILSKLFLVGLVACVAGAALAQQAVAGARMMSVTQRTAGSEVVDGVTWYYTLDDGKATIVTGEQPYTGSLTVPTTLGGCPVKMLGDGCFCNNDALISVIVPEGVEVVGNGTFSRSPNLVWVSLPDSVTNCVMSTFYGCKSLQDARLPSSLDTFCAYYFHDTAVTNIVIPATVKVMEHDVFWRCTHLESVTLPAALTTMHYSAFQECSSLKSIEFPAGFQAFGTLDGVRSQIYAAFGSCTSLETAIFHGHVPENFNYSWLIQLGCKIYYPKEFAAEWEAVVPVANFGGYVDEGGTDPEPVEVDGITLTPFAATGYEAGAAIEPIQVTYAGEAVKPQIAVKGLPKGVTYKNGVISGTPNQPGRASFTVTVTSDRTVVATGTFEFRVNHYADARAPLEESYGPFIPGEPMDLVLASVQGWKVSGLPSGVSFNMTEGRLTGTPKKPGDYTLIFTRTLGFAVHAVSTTLTIAPLREVSVSIEGEGTVKGAGAFAANARVKLTAQAAKQSVLQGWYSADGELLSQDASFTYTVGTDDQQTLVAKFVSAADDRAAVACALDETVLSTDAPLCVTNVQGVAVSMPLSGLALSKVTLKAAGLPAGLTLKDGQIVGAPTTVSKLGKDGTYQPAKVTVTLQTAAGASVKYPLQFVVLPRAAWTVGTFTGAYFENEQPRGTVTLTVAANGKGTGRLTLVRDGRSVNVSLKTTMFASYEAATQVAVAEVEAKESGRAAQTFTLVWTPDALGVGCVHTEGETGTFGLVQDLWKNPPAEFPSFATAARDQVTRACANGLTLKFGAKGKVTCAGALTGTDGKPVKVSGSTTVLLACADEGTLRAGVVLFVAPKKNLPDGYLAVMPLVFTTNENNVVTGVQEDVADE